MWEGTVAHARHISADRRSSTEHRQSARLASELALRGGSEVADLGGRADERDMLCGFLDWYRSVVEHKVEGLGLDDASREMTATGLSPLGVVAHLAAVEVGWFKETFAGAAVDPMWDEHGSFRLRGTDTVESVLDEYRDACAQSRDIVSSAALLDALSACADPYRGNVSLRWILVHMIEETARHAGHLDIMREAIDGQTGD
jgi:uncharacterized damage-inducible protein DinB